MYTQNESILKKCILFIFLWLHSLDTKFHTSEKIDANIRSRFMYGVDFNSMSTRLGTFYT